MSGSGEGLRGVGTVIRIRTKFVVVVAIVMTALLALLSPVAQIVVKAHRDRLFMDGTGQPLATRTTPRTTSGPT